MFSTNTSVQGKEQANKLLYHTSHITEDIVRHVCQMSLPIYEQLRALCVFDDSPDSPENMQHMEKFK